MEPNAIQWRFIALRGVLTNFTNLANGKVYQPALPISLKPCNLRKRSERPRHRRKAYTPLPQSNHLFTRSELGPVVILSLILALRLLGIFLVLPIFSSYALDYAGATLPLAGIAFGIYALVQSVLQIPLGWASDRWGRKPVILAGLALFTLGSLSCGLANNIVHLILARALQGCGAIGSVAIAALADLTRPAVRAQAFTITGIAVGFAFMLGILGGPLLAANIGFHGLFYLLALFGLLALMIAGLSLPQGNASSAHEPPISLKSILAVRALRPIYAATFVLSFTLNLFFFTYPLKWTEFGLETSRLWEVYMIIFLPSALLVFPVVRYAEKWGRLWCSTQLAWFCIAAGYSVYLWNSAQSTFLYVAGAAFFLGYSLFQPLLPSFLTQRIPSGGRGTATGFYNFAGFFGASLGGMLAGHLTHLGPSLSEMIGLSLVILWFFIGLPRPPESSS